ncbi:hypothetical protein AXF42_Ash014687 [Apostasia shenzhenica]|uniref:Uncharacterized protein n=1 Tax=Apostasia shenzhenica TaxID=1088818 RepID=A0A2I0AKH1_9ASPA|nr:hypothetical protein AXF42_Ash014687 [Apostasia shenzhenica]
MADGVVLERSSMNPRRSDAVVNYSSSSYGRLLFRSPNSPPPSPSTSPPLSIDALSQLFLRLRSGGFSSRPATYSSPFPLHQPPLLPLPRSSTLPIARNRMPAVTAASAPSKAVRSRRRKAKASAAARKKDAQMETSRAPVSEPSLTPTVVKDDGERKSIGAAVEESLIESPPPSSLPVPRFTLTRPKASGCRGGAAAGSRIAEAAAAGGDDLRRMLRI